MNTKKISRGGMDENFGELSKEIFQMGCPRMGAGYAQGQPLVLQLYRFPKQRLPNL